jgi:ABC-type phosphate/phosphonate transport system permease subunit
MLATNLFIAVALWTAIGTGELGDPPPSWALLAVAVAAVVAYAICELFGFRTKPLDQVGEPAEVADSSWQRFANSTHVRLMICDVTFLITIPLGFIVQSFWVVLLGLILALPLGVWEAWPGTRNQRRFAAALESRGVPSYLSGRLRD